MDSQKVVVKKTSNQGLGVFALDDINKDEVIAMFDGDIYDKDFDGWTDEILDHVIQFAPLKWRDSKGIARRLNHSCEPNCGIKDLFKIVAMRDIKKGEELTWDYEMTEKNEFGWRMKCRCGTESCRKSIGNFKNMPLEVRVKYEGYISGWLVS